MRFLGIDTNFVVRSCPYLAQLVLVLITDYYFWKVLKRILPKDAARLSYCLFFFNKF